MNRRYYWIPAIAVGLYFTPGLLFIGWLELERVLDRRSRR